MIDLAPAIRAALMGNPLVADAIEQWNSEPAIFTRRPVPANAPHRIVLVNPDAAIGDEDGLTSDRPVVMKDIAVYGRKGEPGTAKDDTRAIEAIGYAIREQFHRQKFSMQPDGFSVISINARGPFPAPTDDDETVGRIVSLTVRLRRA